MAINLAVLADVIDISSDSPVASDIFLVDTNVWFWTAYSKASLSGYQRGYDLFLKKALAAGSRLYVSGLSQSELMHIIEKTERELFDKSIPAKEFRHNYPTQRASVVAEVTAAWGVVQNIAETINITLDLKMADRALARFQTCAMDGYDLISAEVMFEHGIPQILTDDGDFSGVQGVHLFTANRSVLQAATAQGKIVTR